MTTTERPLVLPGDPISPDLIPSSTSKPLRLGPGLRHVPPSDIVPVVAGQLITNHQKNSMWVEYNNNRLKSSAPAQTSTSPPYPPTPPMTLPHLSFESATKKTRPQLAPGALVYARVVLANKHMDPEIECVSQSTGKSDGLGELKGGMVFDVSLQFARRLLMAKSKEEGKVEVLELLGGEGLVFEIAVGRNGKVWVGGEDVKTIVVVGRALRETDEGGLGVEAQRKLVRRLAKGMK
ncbi:exosome non-catalytic core subunit rrp40 [Podospora pseudoanserina]|uniref:Exosome non-catalytic core subunit rrp40 n=1 Tax=Podospora pseudoanserina TaxID=2609844 RepID=A0ABR0IRF0_9PEZI|nr:exosome non-catalytic core subunit rrp40 [Podospora pseudoanserina]